MHRQIRISIFSILAPNRRETIHELLDQHVKEMLATGHFSSVTKTMGEKNPSVVRIVAQFKTAEDSDLYEKGSLPQLRSWFVTKLIDTQYLRTVDSLVIEIDPVPALVPAE